MWRTAGRLMRRKTMTCRTRFASTVVAAAAAALGTMSAGCRMAGILEPPTARMEPHVRSIHGDTTVDDYYWLRQRDNPKVIEYLEAENRYTEAVMKPTEPLQRSLYDEMRARIKQTDLSVPARDGDYYYYSRTFEGKQYSTYCRKSGDLDAPEEVILNLNELAAAHEYFRLGAFTVSPDHRLLAYSIDLTGAEVYTVHVKDLRSGERLDDEIPETYYGLQWANDNRTLFYTTLDHARRPWRVHRHTLGTDSADDAIIYQEDDEAYHVRLSKTLSKRFIVITLASQITSEVRLLDADDPSSAPRLAHPREHGMEYYVAHHGEHFFIRTNDQAVNFRLMRAPVDRLSKSNWIEVLPHRPQVKLEGVDAFQDHLVVHERRDGLRRIRILGLSQEFDHYIDFPEPVYTVFGGENREYDAGTCRLQYTSLVTPRSVYDYDISTRQLELKKRQEVRGGYDPNEYQSARIHALADDGARVPISLVYCKGLRRDGSHPALLYGYGSYGASMPPFFSSNRVSLLDRGFVFAIAHVRGGGDLGRPWYEDGKLLKKKNTFTDFIACAEHLIAQGYTAPDRLAIMGASAGGLLMGSVTNMRPDLFKAVVAQVPFVDVINTMLDDDIPLTVVEYEEWGDPREREYYEYMRSYSSPPG